MALRLSCLVLLGFLFSAAAVASGQAPVYFDPQDAFIADEACDEVFCVEVHIGDCDSIEGYSVAITYDTSHLTLGSVSESGFLGPQILFWQEEFNPPYATVTVDNGASGDPVPGPGHLFTLCFEPLFHCTPGDGPMQLVFETALVRTRENQPIPIYTVDGTVTVRCGITSPESTTWGGIRSLYR